MTVNLSPNSANYKRHTRHKSYANMKCNITFDVINLDSDSGGDCHHQCRKSHPRPAKEKRLARRKVKYDYEKGKGGHARAEKCEKYIVKISTISKYTLHSIDELRIDPPLPNHLIRRNFSNFLERENYEEEEKYKIDEGNETARFHLNWIESADGNNSDNNVVIAQEGNREQETVNDELKATSSPLLRQAGNDVRDKSKSTATALQINLHSLCQLTKTIPKQLLQLARLSKEMLDEELMKRTRRHDAMSDETIARPTHYSKQRNDIVERDKSLAGLKLLDRKIHLVWSYMARSKKDELKDNALEEEEELKDDLDEMGSNISRHSGKGLSGRRTQSSGNLCNGKLVSNVGKLLVPCTKQGEEMTEPNRYKLCASLPNYLEKENLDDLEPCKFPYGINNNNNNELEFYDIKKDLDFKLKPILINREEYKKKEFEYKDKLDEEYPPDILSQQNLQDRGGGEKEQQICQVHPFINQNSSTFLVCIEKGTRGLGLSVMGGCDTDDHLIRIKRIFPHTPAAQCGVLSQGDVILTVNDVPLTGLSNYEALEVLRMTYNIVHLKVYRPTDVQNQIPAPPNDPPPPPPKREPTSNTLVPMCCGDEDERSGEFDIVLTKHNGSLGFTLRKEDESVLGHYVRALVREPALSDGRIQQGDKIVAVNGVEMSQMTHEEAVKFLRQCGDDVRLRLYRDATQTPVTALSPSRQHKQIKPILRKEAMDMLSDLAVKKLSPQASTNSSRSSSPRCRKLKPSSDHNNQTDSRILSPTRPESLDFNNGEKKTRYQFSSPESETGSPSSCSSNTSSIASQILPVHQPPPMLDEPSSLPPALPSSPPPLHHSQEPASMPPLFSKKDDSPSPPYFLVKDTDDPYKASMDLSKTYSNPPLYQEGEPSSMPPMGCEPGFQHGNPSYQSTIPVSSKKLETRHENGGTSIPDLPAMLSPPPVESSKGLLKWKGVVFSPDESEDHVDKIKPPLAFSVSSNGDDQIVVVELNRGWNSRLGFSLAEGPNSSTVISAIHADSVASRDGRLKMGDQIVMVNDESVEAMSTPDIIDLLRKIRGSICIRVHRKNKSKAPSD